MSSARSKVLKLTDGVLSATTDLLLAFAFYGIEFATKPTIQGAGEAMEKDLVSLNSDTIKRALAHLKTKGLIQAVREKTLEGKITSAGKRRLRSTIPVYDSERVWDGILYLVTYDIPTVQNHLRDLLRRFLLKIGCGLLQESVWINPYNPTKLVEQFVSSRNIDGTILVSHIGKDGSIGGMALPELIEKVYKLDALNLRYADFLSEYEAAGTTDRHRAIFAYLSILRDDPQLPFKLLPDQWLGEGAYKLFRRIAG